MAITSAFCDQAKLDFINGVHQPTDTYKIALYTSSANLGSATAQYTASNEASGQGYTSGGKALTGLSTGLDGQYAYMTFDNPVWANSTITARGALVYNSSKSNKAIAVINFSQDYSNTNGNFDVTLPSAGADALVVIG